MNIYTEKCTTYSYYKALNDSVSIKNSQSSRAGTVYDMGPSYFELNNDHINLPTTTGRGLNIFFAIAEVAWMLSYSNKLDTLQYYIKKYNIYSDDGKTLNGAYGHRISKYFKINQLNSVINELTSNPTSRRAVIQIYAPNDLENTNSKDIPCNISILFKIRNSVLDMTVINRSNDIFMGVPYNLFLFQSLQYKVSTELCIPMGKQRHFTDSLHAYEKNMPHIQEVISKSSDNHLQKLETSLYRPIFENIENINNREFHKINDKDLKNLFVSYEYYRDNENIDILQNINSNNPYRQLVQDWIETYHSKQFTRDYNNA
jgi:thymidylate synthase